MSWVRVLVVWRRFWVRVFVCVWRVFWRVRVRSWVCEGVGRRELG